jgi:hypothetical protein
VTCCHRTGESFNAEHNLRKTIIFFSIWWHINLLPLVQGVSPKWKFKIVSNLMKWPLIGKLWISSTIK